MKENYNPVSILAVLLRIFGKSLFIQMSDYFEDIFNKKQCGYCKSYNTKQYLLKMLKKRKNSVYKNGVFGALLTDYPKRLTDSIINKLIAKLNAYDE